MSVNIWECRPLHILIQKNNFFDEWSSCSSGFQSLNPGLVCFDWISLKMTASIVQLCKESDMNWGFQTMIGQGCHLVSLIHEFSYKTNDVLQFISIHVLFSSSGFQSLKAGLVCFDWISLKMTASIVQLCKESDRNSGFQTMIGQGCHLVSLIHECIWMNSVIKQMVCCSSHPSKYFLAHLDSSHSQLSHFRRGFSFWVSCTPSIKF